MSERAKRSPEPLPFADLLAALKARGLPIGVREHLVVARLLRQWDDPSTESLCNALAAVLARNREDAKLVRDTFGQLYAPDARDYASLETARKRVLRRRPEEAEAVPEPPVILEAPPTLWVRLRRAARVQWIAWLAVAALLVSSAYLARSLSWSHQAVKPPPQELPSRPDAPKPPPKSPVPPVIDRTRWLPNRELSLAVAAAAALLLFNWLYIVRAGQQAGRRGRRRWADELDAMPGPQDYELALAGRLKSPFSSALLDEVAKILGRHSTIASGELDVDRTLERTLRAGLAPQVVLRPSRLSHPLVVLEDVGEEMETFRPQVTALLDGLKARGLPMERWQFDVDAGRLLRASGKPGPSFEKLARLHGDSPLLILSTGQGLRRGAGQTPWVQVLRRWRRRAWLHPAVDLRYWRPELTDLEDLETDVWPMTPDGLLAVAKLLVRGFGPEPPDRTPAEHRVVPLDVDRLRWLLSLAPQRTPELAELLRQQFCPRVPATAWVEAWDAPPLDSPPAIGPSAAEVHAFLWEVLQKSRPPERSAGYGRWRLDRALQALEIPGMEKPALAELRDLAKGPMALEVEHALEPLAASSTLPETSRLSLRGVLRRARRRAVWKGLVARKTELRALLRRSLPTVGELAAAAFVIGALFIALPRLSKAFQEEKQVSIRWAYLLTVRDPEGTGPFTLHLQRREGFENSPDRVEIFRGGKPFGDPIGFDGNGRAQRTFEDRDRGWWYHAQAEMGENVLAVSNKELVGRQGFTGWLMIIPEDEKDQVLERALLILEREPERLERVGVHLIELTTGEWTLRVSAPGFEPAEQKILVVAGDRSAPRAIRVHLQAVPPPTPTPTPAPTPAVTPNPGPGSAQAPPPNPEPGATAEPATTPEKTPAPVQKDVSPPPPAQVDPGPPLSPSEVREVVLSVLGRFKNDDLHLEGQIPDKLLKNARKQISLPPEEKILALLDVRDTIRKMHPFLFGTKGVYYLVHKRDHPDPTRYIPYEELMDMRFKTADRYSARLGDGDQFTVAGSQMSAEQFVTLLDTVADELTRKTSEARRRRSQ